MVKTAGLILLLCTFYAKSLNNAFMEMGSTTKFAKSIIEILDDERVSLTISCNDYLLKYANDLLIVYDSNSKFPSGFLSGHLTDLGSFDECLNVKEQYNMSESVFGKYCLARIPLNLRSIYNAEELLKEVNNISNPPPDGKIGIGLSICMPHTCSAKDLRKIYSAIGLDMNIYEESCQTKETQPQLDEAAYMGISFFAAVVVVMILSTIYDITLWYLNKSPTSFYLVAFSVLANGRSLMATSRNSNQISCLHGIRVITTMWIIYGHSRKQQFFLPANNEFYNTNWYSYESNMVVMNGRLGVDTFFLIGGLLVSYNHLVGINKGIKFNIFLHYFHRYIRLTPVVISVLIFYTTLLTHMGSGPLWTSFIHEDQVSVCKRNWWKVLLYIQNYGYEGYPCIKSSWYLSVDFQLYLLSPIILIPLKKWPNLTMLFTGFLTVCSAVWAFYVGYIFQLSVVDHTMTSPIKISQFFQYYYYSTWTRAATWLIGIIFGHILYKLQESKVEIVMNKIVVLCLWLISIGILSACVFAGHNFILQYNQIWSSLYLSLVRPVWAGALCWVIFGCFSGYGGAINRFLGIPLFEVVSKLTFTLYLVHLGVVDILKGQIRETTTQGYLQPNYTFWGDLVFSLNASIILALAFEFPVVRIEKLLFRTKERVLERELLPQPPRTSGKDEHIV